MLISALFSRLLEKSTPIDWETPATQDGCKVSRLFADTDRYIVDFADGFTEAGWLQPETFPHAELLRGGLDNCRMWRPRPIQPGSAADA